jgi:hypothetical protein
MDVNNLVDGIFGIDQKTKEANLLTKLSELTAYHSNNCKEYSSFLNAISWKTASSIEELPYLPVRIFKEMKLKSIPDEDVFRTLTSSGTTGDNLSHIYLDKEAAKVQSQLLVQTLSEVIGKARLPMLIIDSKAVTAGTSFSARGAGVLGMMNLGRKHAFALDNEMKLDKEAVREFLKVHGGSPFLIFGFTFMVWTYLANLQESIDIDLSHGTLIHSGGWKKLADTGVSHDEFRRQLNSRFGLAKLFNFYGMVEQIGTIFIESEAGDGSLTCPSFADVIIRDPISLKPLPNGEIGLIQTISTLPVSYPGHSILTEDLGFIEGVDDQKRLGKRFRVQGRLLRAEVRGCSDTFRQQ